jgi:predicted phosphate transport protein (TIGR00153 family)
VPQKILLLRILPVTKVLRPVQRTRRQVDRLGESSPGAVSISWSARVEGYGHQGLEHEADNLTHDIIDRINRTFVTPFDREDIHELASELDDVIDLIDGAARRAQIFRIQQPREAAVVLSEVLSRAARTVEEGEKNMKSAKHVYAISEKLKVLEEEGDAVYHDAMGKLFAEGGDALEVIKWKDLYDKVEDALDRCEDVGNVLQSIALKNA